MSRFREFRNNASFPSSSDKTTLGGTLGMAPAEGFSDVRGSLVSTIPLCTSTGIDCVFSFVEILEVVSVLMSPLSSKRKNNSCSRTIHGPSFNCKASFNSPSSLNNKRAGPSISSILTTATHSSGKLCSLSQLHSSWTVHSFNAFDEQRSFCSMLCLKLSKYGFRSFIRTFRGPFFSSKADAS